MKLIFSLEKYIVTSVSLLKTEAQNEKKKIPIFHIFCSVFIISALHATYCCAFSIDIGHNTHYSTKLIKLLLGFSLSLAEKNVSFSRIFP